MDSLNRSVDFLACLSQETSGMMAWSRQKGHTGPPFYFNNYIILFKLITSFVKQLTFGKMCVTLNTLSFHGMISTYLLNCFL
jgi:hypothetical protein